MKHVYIKLTEDQRSMLSGIVYQLIDEMNDDQEPDTEEIEAVMGISEAIAQPAQTPEGMAHEIHRLKNLVQVLQLEKALLEKP